MLSDDWLIQSVMAIEMIQFDSLTIIRSKWKISTVYGNWSAIAETSFKTFGFNFLLSSDFMRSTKTWATYETVELCCPAQFIEAGGGLNFVIDYQMSKLFSTKNENKMESYQDSPSDGMFEFGVDGRDLVPYKYPWETFHRNEAECSILFIIAVTVTVDLWFSSAIILPKHFPDLFPFHCHKEHNINLWHH